MSSQSLDLDLHHIVSSLTDRWRASSVTSIILWSIGISVGAVFLKAIISKLRSPRFPIANPSPAWDIFNITSMISYIKSAQKYIDEGFQTVRLLFRDPNDGNRITNTSANSIKAVHSLSIRTSSQKLSYHQSILTRSMPKRISISQNG